MSTARLKNGSFSKERFQLDYGEEIRISGISVMQEKEGVMMRISVSRKSREFQQLFLYIEDGLPFIDRPEASTMLRKLADVIDAKEAEFERKLDEVGKYP